MSERKYLIHKAGRGFYRPNSSGYTDNKLQAGRYTLEEARSISHPNGLDGPRDGMIYGHEDTFNCHLFDIVQAERNRIADDLEASAKQHMHPDSTVAAYLKQKAEAIRSGAFGADHD